MSPPDTVPPTLFNVAAANVTSNSATISWTSDEASDSQVEYGPDSGYGQSTPVKPSLVTLHTVPLSGLAPDTVYHYRVRSADAAMAMSRPCRRTRHSRRPAGEQVTPTS